MTEPDWEGAGVFSSYSDLGEALTQPEVSPSRVAFAAAGAGLDTLGVIADPLDSLLAAGFGWLMEHVDFLSEPLDALAGDPDAVMAQARAWHGVAADLTGGAEQYRHAVAGLPAVWDGDAATAYLDTVQRCLAAMEKTARDAEQLANVIVDTGALVGTTRALIRDITADFLANVTKWLVTALATATVTAGVSIGALVASVVIEACRLAHTFVRRIGDLLDLLDDAGRAAWQLGDAVRDTATHLAAATRHTADGIGGSTVDTLTAAAADIDVPAAVRRVDTAVADTLVGGVPSGVRDVAETVNAPAAKLPRQAVVEYGKQGSELEQEQDGWDRAAG